MNIPRSFPLQRFLRGPLGQLLVQVLILSQLFQGWPSWQSNAAQAPNPNASSPNPAPSTNSSSQKSPGGGSGASTSAQVGVFGPKDYVRDRGQPFVVTDSFSAPVGICTLRITNGGLKKQYPRVSSAVATLNGLVVVGPSDFNKNVTLIERQVKLQNQNILSVEMFSEPGSGFTLHILCGQLDRAPIADAGPDQTTPVLQTVQLDGSRSTDADGDPLSYRWSIRRAPAGSASAIIEPTAVKPTLFIDKPGTYEIELIVRAGGADSSPDTVLITTINSAPVANAGTNQTVLVTDTVVLDGSKSTDVDGDELSYRWAFVTRPASSKAELSNATAIKPTFVVDVPGSYVVQLIVNDGKLDSGTAVVTITTINSPPIADAGPDQSASIGQTIQLDGSGSRDVDKDALSHRWALITAPAGSKAALDDTTLIKPKFTLDIHGDYVAQLIVNDGQVDSAGDTVVISTINSKPVADAGPDQSKQTGEDAVLDGSASSDADRDPLTYRWSILSVPTDSQITLFDADTLAPRFVPDRPGFYVFQLIVNDGFEDSSPDTVRINVAQSNRPPVITSTPVTNATVDVLYNYAVTATDPDPGDKLSFSLPFAPAGMTIDPLTGLIQWTPTAAQVGLQNVTVRVTDAGGLSAPQNFTVIVIQPNRAPTITSTPIPTATATLPYSYQVTATDPDVGDVLTFSLSTGPSGLTINLSTGLISWTPTLAHVGQQNVTVRVTDTDGLFAEQSFAITVIQPNHPPSITSTPLATAMATLPYSYQVVASDPNNGDVLTYSLSTSPTGMTVNPSTGLIQWTPTPAQIGSHSVAVRATDTGGLFASQEFSLGVTQFNRTPVITSVPIVTYDSQSCRFTDPGWTAQAPMFLSRYAPGSAVLDGLLYQIAGCDSGGCGTAFTASVEAYSPDSNTWTFKGSLSAPRAQLAASVIADRIYAVGGSSTSSSPLATLEVYDLSTDTWSIKRSMPTARIAPVAASIDGLLYVVGGHGVQTTSNTISTFNFLEVYDPQTDSWVNKTPMPTSRAYAGGGVISGKFYVVGGLTTSRGLLTTLEVYDPGTDSWATKAPMPTARDLAGVAVIDGKLYVVGGSTASSTLPLQIYDVVEVYDPVTDTWTSLAPLPTPRYGPGAGVISGRLYVAGGFASSPLATLEVLEPTTTPYTYDVDAVDLDGDSITFSLTQAPPGMTVNAATGVIHWIPAPDQTGIHSVTVQALDSRGATAEQNYSLNVKPIRNAPTFVSTAPSDASIGVLYRYNVEATDSDVCDTLVYSLTKSPIGMVMNSATGLIQWTPQAAQIGSHGVTVRVTDQTGEFSEQDFTISVFGNRAPRIISSAETNATATQLYTYQVTATDPDVGDVLTFSLTTAPNGMTIDSTTGLISWTPAASQLGPNDVTVRVTDYGALYVEQSFSVSVAPSSNRPPIAVDDEYAIGQDQALIVKLPTAVSVKQFSAYFGDLDGFGKATGHPLPQVTFDDIAPGTDITGKTIAGMRFELPGLSGTSAPLIVVRGADTVTPSGFTGVLDAATNKVFPTSGQNVLSPGGTVLAPGNQPLLENDGLKLVFSPPVSAVGLDILFQSLDCCSLVSITVIGTQGNVLYSNSSIPTGNSGSGGDPGGALFVGFASPQHDIASIVIDENDSNSVFPDANIGFDTIRIAWFGILANDSDPEGAVLSAVLVSEPTNGTLQLNTNGTFTYQPRIGFSGVDSFSYKVTDGQLDSNVATVRINVSARPLPPNRSPIINSTPLVLAVAGEPYVYAVNATDPDAGDVLTYSLPATPSGMTINPQTGLIAWTPALIHVGNSNVTVRVTDSGGLFAEQSFTVTVLETPPTQVAVPHVVGLPQADAESAIQTAQLFVGTITVATSDMVLAGRVISQTPVGGASVPKNTSVNLVVSTGPAVATVPNVVGQAQSTAEANIAAANLSLGTITSQNSTTVATGIVISQTPAAGTIAPAGSTVSLVVSLGPAAGDIDQDGDGFTPNQGDCDDATASIHPGAFDIPGDGIDQNCNGVDSIPEDNTPPTVSIDSPPDLAIITKPTDIIGNVNDPNFLRHKLEIASVDSNTFTVIGSGTNPVSNGVLGRVDPTLLENGLYKVRLTAEDVNGQTTVEEKVYRITGEAKVGIFALSFIDLQIPVSGIPITVIRSYDSRVKAQRDFGIGWSLQVKTGTYQHNRRPGEGWTINDQPFLGNFLPCIGGTTETKSHFTEVRLSDREAYTFALTITNGNLGITGACEGTASFRFLDGTTPGATLEILDGSGVIYLRGGADQVLDMNAFLDGTERIYDPQKVRLITADGRKIDFDRALGITRIEDNNGNALSVTPVGIVHTSGKSIAFQRDALRRITRITDPMGHTLNYGYDANGDLAEFIDQANNRTTFSYDARHNLLEIRDPLGNRAVRSEYDTDGRLIATIDAKGRRTEFAHDLARREEMTTDTLGNITRLIYDEQGNILSHERPVTIGGTTVLARSQYAYDPKGNQTLIIDPDNIRWENTYDAFGNPLSMTVNPGGLNIARTATYTAAGAVLTETNPNGDTIQFAYDTKANPNRWNDVDGRMSILSYNSAGQVTQFEDPDGRITQVQYDATGHVQTRTDSLGNVTVYTYDANGNRLTASVSRNVRGELRGLTTTYTYDAKNRLIQVTNPLGGVARIEYNAIGLKSAEVDALGRRTSFTYDETGALVRTDYSDGTSERREYDAVGDLVAIIDREGLKTVYQFDELRRSTATVLPDGRTTRTVYTPGGRIAATIAADGSRTDYGYDAGGRLILARQPLVVDAVSGTQMRPEWRFEYDAGGRRTAVVDPKGNRTQFLYDSLARTMRARFPDGTEVTEHKDQWGRTLRRIDQEGNQTTFDYITDTSRLAAVTLPTPATGQAAPIWRFAYDEVGNRLSQTDPLGRITRFEYDEMNRLTTAVLPAGQNRSFSYDAIGRVIGLADFDGSTSKFEYDAADRLVRKILSDGSITSFTYTPGGRRSSVVDQRGTTSYSYDAAGRLIRRTQPDVGDIEYAYDLLDRITRITAPAGSTAYTYDALGRLTDVSTASGSTSYAFDLANNLTSLNMANSVTGTFAYDSNNRLTSLNYQKGGQILGSFAYTYTPAGRRATVAQPGAATSFTYDRIGRLIQEERTGATAFARQYEYDAAGNRSRMLADGVQTLYSYDANDRLLTAGSSSFTYDDRGNLTGRNDAGVFTTYAWTPDNRLARLTRGSGTFTYRYDADGIRVEKQSLQGTVRYLVDALNPTRLAQVLEERNASGNLLKKYEYGNGPISSSEGVTQQFYHPDGQGHIRMLTDGSGQATTLYDYDAFGNLVAETGATPNDYLYAGQQFDRDASLYYLRARYYDSGTGRFLGSDPVNGNPMRPLSLHRYVYAGNDPCNFADPSGEDFTLLGFSFANLTSGALRGIELGYQAKKICDIKGLAKIIPLAIGAREWLAKRSQLLDKLVGILTPSVGFGGSNSTLVSSVSGAFGTGSAASLIPSFGLAYKEEFFKHPLADLVPPPHSLNGDTKKVEVEVSISPSNLTQVSLKIGADIFPNAQAFAGPFVIQAYPNWAFISGGVGFGGEIPLFDIKVCGFVSVGTVSVVAAASGGVGSSGVSGSVELGLKVAVPFLPEGNFTILKAPDDFR